jgi:hypothetical protein
MRNSDSLLRNKIGALEAARNTAMSTASLDRPVLALADLPASPWQLLGANHGHEVEPEIIDAASRLA